MYEMESPDSFWDLFETNLQIHGASLEEIQQKAAIITKICKAIRGMNGEIDEEDAWDFIYHYEKTNKHLPNDNEIDAIAIEYIKMAEESGTMPNQIAEVEAQEASYKKNVTEVIVEGDITITPTDALKEMVKEMPTLDEDTKKYYISLFDKLALPDQELLVSKIKAIEADLSKVPYLLDEERIKLRNSVFELTKEKRREKLAQLIKERSKNEAYYMTLYMDQQIKGNLKKLPFLTLSEVDDIMNIILTSPFEEKKNIVSTVYEVEQFLNNILQKGIALTNIERKNMRLDLIRLPAKERIQMVDRIIEERKAQIVGDILIQEIPSLQFENNEKLIKELMWLSEEELKQRINKIKTEKSKSSQEKSKIFETSAAGSACKKCGWPMGQFSKKCPRCGWSVDDWFKI
jgi:hypothetical protein